MKKIKWRFAAVLGIVLMIAVFAVVEARVIDVTEYKITDSEIPAAFDGYRIAFLSDLHNARFGRDQSDLIAEIEKSKIDIIIIGGDIAIERVNDYAPAVELAAACVKLAPTYYASGNHDVWAEFYEQMCLDLQKEGVKVLHNEAVTIRKDESEIQLIGLEDPFVWNKEESAEITRKYLENTTYDSAMFSILLMHRPELIDYIEHDDFHLVLSGHNHGGLIRLPFIGGLFNANRELFADYISGAFTIGQTQMIVSRGLGNSVVIPRIFNGPELVIIELGR